MATMNRRTALRLGAGAALSAAAGCLGVLTGEEPLTFEASRATVRQSALDDTGYAEDEVSRMPISREFSAAGQTREVEVTNWLARYERSLDLGPLGEQEIGLFVVLSTPQVRILDRTFNPVGDMSNRELLQQVQGRFEGFSVGSRADTRTLRVLGSDVDVDKFEATATYSGQEIELFVHVATVGHGEDFVVPIAVYPQRLPGEQDRAAQLYRNLEH